MKYEDTATGKVYTGAALMKAGLPLPLTTGDYQPIRFTFKAVENNTVIIGINTVDKEAALTAEGKIA